MIHLLPYPLICLHVSYCFVVTHVNVVVVFVYLLCIVFPPVADESFHSYHQYLLDESVKHGFDISTDGEENGGIILRECTGF